MVRKDAEVPPTDMRVGQKRRGLELAGAGCRVSDRSCKHLTHNKHVTHVV